MSNVVTILMTLAASNAIAVGAAPTRFTPGNIFVAEPHISACFQVTEEFPGDRIWEINPRTGQASVFAEFYFEDCAYITGLAISPDGTRLRAASAAHDTIFEFAPDGTRREPLTGKNGILWPVGQNSIAFDSWGHFFVANGGLQQILEFGQNDNGPRILADVEDNITRGQIGVSAGSSLYFAKTDPVGQDDRVFHVDTQSGEVSVFDEYGFTLTGIAIDEFDTLYVALLNGKIFRYKHADVATKTLIAQLSGGVTITVAHSPGVIYAANVGEVKAIDSLTGEVTVIAADFGAGGVCCGIAVVPPAAVPAVGGWALLVMVLVIVGVYSLMQIREVQDTHLLPTRIGATTLLVSSRLGVLQVSLNAPCAHVV